MVAMTEGTGILHGSAVRRGLLLVALFVYCAVSASFAAFTVPMRVATSLPIVAVIAWAIKDGWHRCGPIDQDPPLSRTTPSSVAAMAVWVLLLVVAAAFQLATYLSEPREVYPTLSSLAGDAFSVAPVRTAGFAAWLALAAYLLVRR